MYRLCPDGNTDCIKCIRYTQCISIYANVGVVVVFIIYILAVFVFFYILNYITLVRTKAYPCPMPILNALTSFVLVAPYFYFCRNGIKNNTFFPYTSFYF